MHFAPLEIVGAMRVGIEAKSDQRGFFARTYCAHEFADQRIDAPMVQSSISYNAQRGTVRGLHFQWPPSQEGKLVRCLRGGIWDVLLDLRPHSTSYLQHQAIPLDENNREAVYIPSGIAHGFQTLTDHTEVLYQMTDVYRPQLQSGVRWNDPRFAIHWPVKEAKMSGRDAQCPDFEQVTYEREYRQRHTA